MQKSGIGSRSRAISIARHAGRGCPSQWRPERSLDVVRKRIDHGTLVVTFIRPEEPAVNERVDLGAVKFDRKTAVSGPMSRPAKTHSLC
jgi:hypothetical protein